jgi:hypothetical protein
MILSFPTDSVPHSTSATAPAAIEPHPLSLEETVMVSRGDGWPKLLPLFRRTTRGRVYAEPRKNRRSGRTMKTRAISNGLASPVPTSEAPDLAGARMERAATDGAAVAGENPAGARDLGPHFPKTGPPFPKTKVD